MENHYGSLAVFILFASWTAILLLKQIAYRPALLPVQTGDARQRHERRPD
jgi:hypothetical protein